MKKKDKEDKKEREREREKRKIDRKWVRQGAGERETKNK